MVNRVMVPHGGAMAMPWLATVVHGSAMAMPWSCVIMPRPCHGHDHGTIMDGHG